MSSKIIKLKNFSIGLFSFAFFFSNPALAQQTYASPLASSPGVSAVLNMGDRVVSQDGRFHFVMQYDGNLVLYQGTTPLWDSGTRVRYQTVTLPGYNPPLQQTVATQGCMTALQPQGNLVIYGGQANVSSPFGPCHNHVPQVSNAMWSTPTANQPGATLHVQNDGNVVLYNTSGVAVWSTQTCCH